MSLQILMFKATRLEVLCIYVTLISIDSWQLVRGRINRREYKCGRSRQSGEARRLNFLPASRRILSQWLGSKRGGASMLSHSKRGRESTLEKNIDTLQLCTLEKLQASYFLFIGRSFHYYFRHQILYKNLASSEKI